MAVSYRCIKISYHFVLHPLSKYSGSHDPSANALIPLYLHYTNKPDSGIVYQYHPNTNAYMNIALSTLEYLELEYRSQCITVTCVQETVLICAWWK